MSADSPRRSSGSSRGLSVPATVPPQVVSDRSILDSAIGFINDVTLVNQPYTDPKDTITWARFESTADISDPRYGDDWELEGNVAPPLLLILGYGLGVQVWAIPANGEALEVLSWRHGIVSALRVLPTPSTATTIEVHERADEAVDAFAEKRPLIAMVDGSASTGSQPQFCAVNFVSLKTGTQVKTIKFKNTVLDILANRSSIVITFHERIAVFDARTLEDRLSITTCYPSPGINPNPVAIGPRWLAYAEHKLIHSKRSAGGCDGEGVASYTATVLNAAKSLGKGLRELGEQVAAGLTGGSTSSGSNSKAGSFDSATGADGKQPGVVTIIDIKYGIKDYSPTSGAPISGYAGSDPVVAHFFAHSEAIVAMEFDNSGMLLVTADRRGHDFHIFRVQPHPIGSSLAAVHHLYVLHRGDTSAKVQNITLSLDSRWVAVSTLRGTTHVFPITPYGGQMGVRTHTSLHVVNKLSRFHRSAGLSAEGRSSSPISHSESTTFMQSLQPFHNPTLPPFPRPTVVQPLTQLRQPFALGSPPGSAALGVGGKGSSSGGGGTTGGSSQRQRLSSLSDDNGKPLSVCAIFAKSRSWLLDPPNTTREAPHRIQRKAVDSLFVMAGHGALIQYDLDTKLASNVAKEKICDDTPIELEVEAKAQWNLGRRKEGSQEIMPPLSLDNWLIRSRNSCMLTDSTRQYDDVDDRAESWLAQVEIITHAGPHRRLWMGPQFVFKTYNAPSGSNLNHVDAEAVEIGISKATTAAAAAAAASGNTRLERSSPLNMPLTATGRSAVPVLIESGSYSSIEQSPKLMDRFRHEHLDSDFSVTHGDSRLKEDLADAMRESPASAMAHKDTGRLPSDAASSDNAHFYDALAEHENDDDDLTFDLPKSSSSSAAAALASALPNIFSYETMSSIESSLESLKKPKVSIEKVVNPLGTVTTVNSDQTVEIKRDMLDEVVSQLAAEDCVIHENCDEALFRPVVAIFCDEKTRQLTEEEIAKKQEHCKPPEVIGNKLIVPVIDKAVDAELCKKEKQKSGAKLKQQQKERDSVQQETQQFSELSNLSKKNKVKEELENKKKLEVMTVKPAKKIELEKVETVLEKSKPAKKLDKTAFSESEEKPIEFKRMTPLPETKVESPRKIFDKSDKSEKKGSELKSDKEQSPNISVATVKSGNYAEQKVKPAAREINAEKKHKQTENAAGGISSAKETTAVIIEDKTITKTATDYKIKVVESNAPAKRSAVPNRGKEPLLKEKTPEIITEKVDTASLADSLIEREQKNEKDQSKTLTGINVKAVKEVGKMEAEAAERLETKKKEIELPKPVEIFTKTSKKNRRKANKSGSNSESEEIIEVTTNKSIKLKPEDKPASDTSTEICSQLDVSLSETEPKVADAMFVSLVEKGNCTQISKDVAENTVYFVDEQKQQYKIKVKESENSDAGKMSKQITKSVEKSAASKVDAIGNQKVASTMKVEAKVSKDENVNREKTYSEDIKSIEKILPVVKKGAIVDEKTKPPVIKKPMPDSTKSCAEEAILRDAESMRVKGDNKKEITKKTVAERFAENKVVPEKPLEITNKTDFKLQDDIIKVEIKTDVSDEGRKLPKSPLKNSLEKPKTADSQVNLLPSTSIKNVKSDSKTDAKSEEIKVITQQPTKTKKDANTAETKSTPYKGEAATSTAALITSRTPKAIEMTKTTVKSSVLETDTNVSCDMVDNIAAGSKNAKGNQSKSVVTAIDSKLLPVSSAWKALSGAEMISKNLPSFGVESSYPSLGKSNKKPVKSTLTESEATEKLLADLATPLKAPSHFKEPLIVDKTLKKAKKATPVPSCFDDFPLLKSLEALPPLPALEPLEVISSGTISKTHTVEQISLINFESPLQENPALDRKIMPPPRGFTEQNLIIALCGSLHYENESEKPPTSVLDKIDNSPTLSSTRSNSALGEQSTAEYKSLTENDDAYMSFEQSSQETNTTNTATTNEKYSSSANSSASEEIIILEEKKMTKKQRRKRQQMEQQKQKDMQQQGKTNIHPASNNDDDDEELCPLIAMTDSLNIAASEHFGGSPSEKRTSLLIDDVTFAVKLPSTSSPNSLFAHSTTTDSEGPMPATTSDDNVVYTMPAAGTAHHHTPNKLKTKKLEHKINLIAAIEAATSSSSSSAEESGVEAGGERSSDMDVPVAVTTTMTSPILTQSMSAITAGAQHCAMKKKTKRRKR